MHQIKVECRSSMPYLSVTLKVIGKCHSFSRQNLKQYISLFLCLEEREEVQTCSHL